MKSALVPRQSFDLYYSGRLGGGLFRWLDRAKQRYLSKVLAEHPTPRRLLDLGCGRGDIPRTLAAGRRSLRVVGADHDSGLLALAMSDTVVGVGCDFDHTLPFVDRAFDVVTMIDTIEHAEDPGAVVGEAMRVLARPGAFVVFTPPYDSLSWVAAEKAHRLVTGRWADHISPFTRESLRYFLRCRFPRWQVGVTNLGLTMYGVGWLDADRADPDEAGPSQR